MPFLLSSYYQRDQGRASLVAEAGGAGSHELHTSHPWCILSGLRDPSQASLKTTVSGALVTAVLCLDPERTVDVMH